MTTQAQAVITSIKKRRNWETRRGFYNLWWYKFVDNFTFLVSRRDRVEDKKVRKKEAVKTQGQKKARLL